jgi:DNA mismatch endonuclease Vsr
LVSPQGEVDQVVALCLDYIQFDAFWDLAEELSRAELSQPDEILGLFREWELVEAREMTKVTEGRIKTIEKLERLMQQNALEVPTLHGFLKEFPWVLDPRWTLIGDEARYSKLLRETFPDADRPEEDRRIDFLCVSEGTHLVVVEIKRPKSRASIEQLRQIEDYVHFIRDLSETTTDPALKTKQVVGYLLCGNLVNTGPVRQKRNDLERNQIFVRRYEDLLRMVERAHKESWSGTGSCGRRRPMRQPDPLSPVKPPAMVPRAPVPVSDTTRRSMQANRSRDTTLELSVRSELHRRGLRFRKHWRPVAGLRSEPDIVFTRARLVVFLDGCWWHRCPDHWSPPRRHSDFWVAKVDRNAARDREHDAMIAAQGWTVLRVWEHEGVSGAADRIEAAARTGLSAAVT